MGVDVYKKNTYLQYKTFNQALLFGNVKEVFKF